MPKSIFYLYFCYMNKTKPTRNDQKPKGKYHEKFHIDATFDEAVKMLVTTPKKKKIKNQQ